MFTIVFHRDDHIVFTVYLGLLWEDLSMDISRSELLHLPIKHTAIFQIWMHMKCILWKNWFMPFEMFQLLHLIELKIFIVVQMIKLKTVLNSFMDFQGYLLKKAVNMFMIYGIKSAWNTNKSI